MSDQPFYAPNHTTAPPQPRAGEPLWTVQKAGRSLACELRDDGEFGVEVQVYREGELLYGRRWATRAGARGRTMIFQVCKIEQTAHLRRCYRRAQCGSYWQSWRWGWR
jgi:hypothetical protein